MGGWVSVCACVHAVCVYMYVLHDHKIIPSLLNSSLPPAFLLLSVHPPLSPQVRTYCESLPRYPGKGWMELFPNESFPNETQDDRVKSKSVMTDVHVHMNNQRTTSPL